MPQGPISLLQPSDFMIRLLSTYPKSWTNDAARQPGGVLYSLLDALFAYDLSFLNGGVIYVQQLTRIKTAVDAGLDTVSQDYFGNGLPRLSGESDSSFRARILAALLQPRVTRPAIQAALTQLTGQVPRMIEPWNPGDTCAWDANSYWDTDDPTYPFRWGDPGARYQGFIVAQEPLYSVTGGSAVPCWDASFYWDTPGSYWLDQTTAQALTDVGAIDSLILAFKAEGTQIWVAAIPLPATITDGYAGIAQGAPSVEIGQTSALYPYMKGFMPLLAIENPSWMSGAFCLDPLVNPPVVQFDTPAPVPTSLGWTAFSPGKGFIRVPLPPGTPSIGLSGRLLLNEPGLETWICHCFPSWNTTKALYFNAFSIGGTGYATFTFGSASPSGGYIDVCYLNSLAGAQGWSSCSAIGAAIYAQPSIVISHGINLPYKAFVIPSWQTQVRVIKSNGTVQLIFSTPSVLSSDGVFCAIQKG